MYGADAYLGGAIDSVAVEPLYNMVFVEEGLFALGFKGVEFLLCLFAQVAGIDQKQNTFSAAVVE